MISRQSVIANFEKISRIPRRSKNEAQIRDFLVAWAESLGFSSKSDPVGNLLVTVPASPGRETAPTLVLQSHLDMVCEKTPESNHDFQSDPLRLYTDGDWLRAEGTTLGADNGIGVALAMALAEDRELARPRLELLFTVDEETGLTGAANLAPGFFTGKTFINLDSEDEGVLIIGCAGGRDSVLRLPLAFAPWPEGYTPCELTVAGLAGGHSGVDIHEQRGNANVVLARALAELGSGCGLELAHLHGGSAHNAIPREARALLALPAGELARLRANLAAWSEILRKAMPHEPNLAIALQETAEAANRIYRPDLGRRVRDLLLAAPDGVMAFSKLAPGVVESSVNLATIREEGEQLAVLLSQRSDKPQGLDWLIARSEGLARLAGATISTGEGYPGWPPEPASPLLARASQVYRQMFGVEPTVRTIHAGLECGIIGAKYPGLDLLSLGPTVRNPHSPEERLSLSSLDRFCPYLRTLVSSLE